MKGFPIAREGLVFIGPSLFLSFLFGFLHLWILFIICFFFFLFFLFFFRNPERSTSAGTDYFISPADGRVVEISTVDEGEFIRGTAQKIGIFMSPLDVHVNRAPFDGIVRSVCHRAGEFALAFKKDIDKENERNYVLFDCSGDSVLVVQIAGFLARRIICKVKETESVVRGQRIGMIAFGSRVDLYVPVSYDCVVQLHDKVRAGITPLARKQGVMNGTKKT